MTSSRSLYLEDALDDAESLVVCCVDDAETAEEPGHAEQDERREGRQQLHCMTVSTHCTELATAN